MADQDRPRDEGNELPNGGADSPQGDGRRRVPPEVAAALAQRPVEEVLAMVLMRQRHLEEAVKRLRTLVPDAFKEGFAQRDPTVEEPWLADWLTSETKQVLDGLFERKGRPTG